MLPQQGCNPAIPESIELLDDCSAVYRIHPGGFWPLETEPALSLSAREEGKRLNTGTAHPLLSPQWRLAASRLHHLLVGLATYTLIDSWYKVFSRAKFASGG